jgi:hypothetical protein
MHTIATLEKTAPALRWSGRILAALLFLFWGAFFVEHTIEWFVRPYPQTPPAFVWLGQGLHLLMLVGLVALWRWELAGSLLVIASAFAFFVDKAGANFPLFFGVTALSGLLVLCAWWLERSPASVRR